MNWSDYWPVLLHFGSLSLMAVGGAISALPEMHRFLVDEHAYLSEDQFVNSVALGQIAPGPNVMFVALMGWNIALQALKALLDIHCCSVTLLGAAAFDIPHDDVLEHGARSVTGPDPAGYSRGPGHGHPVSRSLG